jgi:hypothetical protein
MIKKIHIYDIDGTLISSSHRYKTAECGNRIDLSHWRKHDNANHIYKDSALPHMAQYKQDLLNPEIYVILATARACTPGDANYKYIARRMGNPNKFVHRQGIEDTRGGAELKISAIKPLLNLRQFKGAAVHIWEDNKDYLAEMVCHLKGIGHYVPSTQGH